jgi:ATP-binding cassette subfamily C protein CydD
VTSTKASSAIIESDYGAPGLGGTLGPFALARAVFRIAGPRISTIFFASVPVGLILGALEILAAYILYLVLVRFNLLMPDGQTSRLAAIADPAVLLLATVLFVSALRYLAQLLPSLANSALETRLRIALANAALTNPSDEGQFSVNEASHLLNAVVPKASAFLQALITCLGTISLLLLISVALARLSLTLTIVAVIAASILGFPIVILKRYCGKFSDRGYLYSRAFSSRFLKDVRNTHFLKLCGLNKVESDELAGIARAARNNSLTYQALFAVSSNLPLIAAAILIVSLLTANEHFGLLAGASLVPFVYLMNRVAGSLGNLTAGTASVRELMPYATELGKYANSLFPTWPSSTIGSICPNLSMLEVNDLEVGRSEALISPVTFSLKKGEMLLISGASGRGKTTLLLTILGLVPRISGKIAWGGLDADKIDWLELRKRVGFAGPEPFLIDADIFSNLKFGLDRTNVPQEEIDKALHISCAEFVYDLRDGLTHELREHGDGISAGQKQRLALARCLLRRPEVLILDEATANIDEETERVIFDRLFEAFPGLLTVAVSHRSSLRKFATAVMEI